MQPTNKKERRNSILKFIAIYLLTILPICIAVYQFARVDSSELDYLRPKLRDQQQSEERSEEKDDMQNEIAELIDSDLKSKIATASQNRSTSQSGEIEGVLKKIDRSLTQFQEDHEHSEYNESYLYMIEDLRFSIMELNQLYGELWQENQDNSNGLDQCEKELEECNSELGR